MPPRDGQGSSGTAATPPGAAGRDTAEERHAWWYPPNPSGATLAGLAAFLVGYVATGVAFVIEMQSARGTASSPGGVVASVVDQAVGIGGRQVVAASGGEVGLTLRAVGWTFLSAQHVPLFGTASGLGVSASGRVDVLAVAGRAVEIPLTPPLYYLLPPVCLAGAGWWLGRSSGARTLRTGAVAGGAVVLGYLPAVAAAALLLSLSVTVDLLVVSATITTEPVFVRALALGAGYAVGFGALGGILAAKTRE